MNVTFTRDGLTLNGWHAAGTGETVIFQHGLCGSAAQTREIFPEDPRYRLATLECRGHGDSQAGSPEHFSIATFADDALAFAQAHAASPFIVGGISMGAAISLRLAVRHPKRVKALVLARPAWVTEVSPPNLAPNREVARLLAQYPPQEARLKFLMGNMASQLSKAAPDNLASLSSFFAREPVATTAALLHRIASDGPGITLKDLRGISVPVLIIATGQDLIHPLSCATALRDAIPHAQYVQITPKGVDKSRHVAEFQSALLSFFESVNAKRA